MRCKHGACGCILTRVPAVLDHTKGSDRRRSFALSWRGVSTTCNRMPPARRAWLGGALAILLMVTSVGGTELGSSSTALSSSQVFGKVFKTCDNAAPVPTVLNGTALTYSLRTVSSGSYTDKVAIADASGISGSLRELYYGGAMALGAAAPDAAVSDIVFAEDVDFGTGGESQPYALVTPTGRQMAIGTACTNTVIDGAHRLDLWNASSDLSMFIYNSHFINNVITYPPFMAGTNKPYVNGKVLYVNVRFSEVCDSVVNHTGLRDLGAYFKNMTRSDVAGLDNGLDVKSYLVRDTVALNTGFVTMRMVNVTFGCVASLDAGSADRALGPPVLDKAYRAAVQAAAMQWQGNLDVDVQWTRESSASIKRWEVPVIAVLVGGVGGILVAIGIVLAVRACKRARRAPQVPSGKVIDEHSAKQKQVTAEVEYVIDGQIPGDQV